MRVSSGSFLGGESILGSPYYENTWLGRQVRLYLGVNVGPYSGNYSRVKGPDPMDKAVPLAGACVSLDRLSSRGVGVEVFGSC